VAICRIWRKRLQFLTSWIAMRHLTYQWRVNESARPLLKTTGLAQGVAQRSFTLDCNHMRFGALSMRRAI
jgi:hypothetical protein